MSKALILDGHNLLWRSYSVPFKFYSKRQTPLHVVTVYLKCIRRSIEAVGGLGDDDLLVVVFDDCQETANHRMMESYKANRQYEFPDGDAPFDHLPLISRMLDWLHIPQVMVAGVEADDVISGLVDFCIEANRRPYIVSTDTDFYQLLGDGAAIVKLGPSNESQIIDEAYVQNLLGITSNQYVMYKSLVGDKADNIAGVPGIGPATARNILNGQQALKQPVDERQLLHNKWFDSIEPVSSCMGG